MYYHKVSCVNFRRKYPMTNRDKIYAIQAVRGSFYREEEYYRLLEDMGDLKQNYRE